MLIADHFDDLIAKRKRLGGRIGFVPTMGALHDGHLALIDIAKQHAQHVVASIYVNPTQFTPDEDFAKYPRDTNRDLAMLKARGVDLVYLPRTADVYPNGPETHIKAGHAAEGLESAFRPQFFDGVCSVCHRLFTQIAPDSAIFGEKDYQQLMVIREMVAAQKMPIKIIGAPIIRDDHGLALSSRNAYLSDDELNIARQLNAILSNPSLRPQAKAGGDNPEPSSINPGLPRQSHDHLAMTNQLQTIGFTKVDYITERWNRRLAAAWIGQTRLIDNIEIN